MKRFILVLILSAIAVVVFSVEPFRLSYSSDVDFSITSDGDTARVITFTPSTGLDSFLYHDSIRFPSDTTLWDTFSWTAPPQQMQITVTWDTSALYHCSLDCGTNIYGFEYDPSAKDDTTVALMIDTLVYLINNTTSMKDTILAEDSISYIKIVSKIAQIQLEGDARWTMKVSTDLDTAAIWVTSVADVCDSMPVYINALDSARFWTAADVDSNYTITGNKNNAGIWFFAVYTDTAQDTTHGADSVSSWSTDSGTVDFCGVIGYKTLDGGIVFRYHDGTYAGRGNVDSCILKLYTGGALARYVLDSVICATEPCTLLIRVLSAIGTDSLRNDLQLYWWVTDSVSDTTMDVKFEVVRDITMEP